MQGMSGKTIEQLSAAFADKGPFILYLISGLLAYASIFCFRTDSLSFLGGWSMLLYYVFGRVAAYTISDVRPDSLCSDIWSPGGKLIFLYYASGRIAYYSKSGVRPGSLCSFFWSPAG